MEPFLVCLERPLLVDLLPLNTPLVGGLSGWSGGGGASIQWWEVQISNQCSWEFSMKNVEIRSKYTQQSTKINPKHFSGYYRRWWVAALLWQRTYSTKGGQLKWLDFVNSCSGVLWLWEKFGKKRTSNGTSGSMGVDVRGQQIFGGGGGGQILPYYTCDCEMRKLRKIISWEFEWKINTLDQNTCTNQPELVANASVIQSHCGWLCGCGGGNIWWMSGSRSGRTAGFRGLGCQWHNVKYGKNGSSDGKSGWIVVDIEVWQRCFQTFVGWIAQMAELWWPKEATMGMSSWFDGALVRSRGQIGRIWWCRDIF